ncbi:hypothetical protein NMT57_24670, partial [Escherichia coli]|nr:hypothetical protein [Escherichia coli]
MAGATKNVLAMTMNASAVAVFAFSPQGQLGCRGGAGHRGHRRRIRGRMVAASAAGKGASRLRGHRRGHPDGLAVHARLNAASAGGLTAFVRQAVQSAPTVRRVNASL